MSVESQKQKPDNVSSLLPDSDDPIKSKKTDDVECTVLWRLMRSVIQFVTTCILTMWFYAHTANKNLSTAMRSGFNHLPIFTIIGWVMPLFRKLGDCMSHFWFDRNVVNVCLWLILTPFVFFLKIRDRLFYWIVGEAERPLAYWLDEFKSHHEEGAHFLDWGVEATKDVGKDILHMYYDRLCNAEFWNHRCDSVIRLLPVISADKRFPILTDAVQEFKVSQQSVLYWRGKWDINEGVAGAAERLEQKVDEDQDLAYKPELAKYAAQFAFGAYCRKDSLDDWPKKCTHNGCHLYRTPDFRTAKVANNENMQGFVGYDSKEDRIVLSFRGTVGDDWDCWQYDIDEATRHFDKVEGSALHAGFDDAWNEVRDPLRSALKKLIGAHPNASILITGHSLGAAMANVAALHLYHDEEITNPKDPKRLIVYTFGTPRWANGTLATYFDEIIPNNWRIVNKSDMVCHVPLKGDQFAHPKKFAYYYFTGGDEYATYKTGMHHWFTGHPEFETLTDFVPSVMVYQHLQYLNIKPSCVFQVKGARYIVPGAAKFQMEKNNEILLPIITGLEKAGDYLVGMNRLLWQTQVAPGT